MHDCVSVAQVDTSAMSTSPGACHHHVEGSIEQDHTPCLNNASDNSKQQDIKVCCGSFNYHVNLLAYTRSNSHTKMLL